MSSTLEIPRMGLGTMQIAPGLAASVIKSAIVAGYRHFDCAYIYKNEEQIGIGIAEVLRSDLIARESLWVTSKLWNCFHSPELVEKAFLKSLQDLQLKYLDLYLVHWPVVFKPGVEVIRDISDLVPFEAERFMETWHEMELLKEKGLVRHIGVSNFSISKLEALLNLADTPPAVSQVELHPYLPQNDYLAFCDKHGIHVSGYSPLGSGDRHSIAGHAGPSLLEHPIVIELATELRATPAQVLLKWNLNRGTSVLPRSSNVTRIHQNFEALTLTVPSSRLEPLDRIGKSFRYVSPPAWFQVGSCYSQSEFW